MSVSPLSGKVVWLTGASSGIGAALARSLAATGCVLALTARRETVLTQLAEELSKSFGAKVISAPGDVRSQAGASAIFAAVQQQLGPVDLLIANAGTHIPTNVAKFDTEEYEEIMRLNYFGALHCIQAVLPGMLARKTGQLVGVSSVAAYRALPYAAAYGASKAALSHFLESIRFDLIPHGIHVSVVSPGFVKTPLTDKNDFPMPCLIDADDAARRMLRGIEQKQFEVHFPKRFTVFLKLLRVIPFPLYYWIISKTVLRNERSS